NGACNTPVNSNVATLTVQQSPVINTQPATQTICEGNAIILNVSASGAGLTYEWFQGATSLGAASATASTLTINNATASNAGNYTVVVRGTCNPTTGVTSAIAAVTIQEVPEVTAHPVSQTICEGGNTSFTVSAGITTTPTFQWQVSTDGGA